MKTQEIQLDYTAYGSGYQLKLPMETGIKIAKDDPVRLLSAISERMDYEELYAAYSEEGRPGYSPRILFKIMSYGYMRKIYSSRGIEQACGENIKFMYLLEGHRAPDHNTIARFRKDRLGETMKGLFGQLVGMLAEAGEIDLSTVYIDGTKIEAQANRYTFVWRKSVEKRLGKLKEKMEGEWPANVATASEYVIGSYLSADCTDTNTLIPFTKQLPMDKIHRLVADAGYESEENYSYFEGLEHTDAYIKPANHEQKKKKKYRTDPGRRENMAYLADKDEYICTQGKRLILSEVKKQKTKTGFLTETSIYRCLDCQGCPCKEKCIRKGSSNKPLEERTKSLYVNKNFLRQREEMELRISSEVGCLLRVNRSIQAEGSFAMTKVDMHFRRFLTRGKCNVSVEWLLLCFAFNLLKLDHKARAGRLGNHLFPLKPKAA